MYVCLCHPITDKQIKQTLVNGAQTTAAVFRHFGHKVQCGKCVPSVRAMVEEHRNTEHGKAKCGGDCGSCGCGEAKPSNDVQYAYGIAAE